MPKITLHLWFDSQAEEAAKYYVSIFRNSKIRGMTRYGKAGFEVHGQPEGKVMTVEFELEGQKFIALNGGPAFKFNEAVSFMVNCENQKEIDYFWEKLTEGGTIVQCGWLKDRFGVSWQVTPTVLAKMLRDPDQQKVDRVTNAFLKMKKFDIQALTRAYEGK